MTLDEEIAWWMQRAYETKSDAAFVAFGVATGLKMAKADYGAKQENNNDHVTSRPESRNQPQDR